MKSPCIVARELVESPHFVSAIDFDHHVRLLSSVEPSDTTEFEVSGLLERLLRRAIERAIEEDRKQRSKT